MSHHPALSPTMSFNTNFFRLTGSINAGLLLNQLYFWTGKQDDPDGWIYKTQENWHEEIYLSRNELETARKTLIKLGYIEYKRAGMPPMSYYRVDIEKLENDANRLCDTHKKERAKQRKNQKAENQRTVSKKSSNTTAENLQTVAGQSSNTQCDNPASHLIYTINTSMKEGNPPKPACSLDTVDAFAGSVIPDVSPSPHPGYADRRSDNPASENCSQGQEVTQENSKQAELSVDNDCGQPVDGGNNFFPGPPEVLLKQDKILGVESSVSFSEQGISQEFNADNCQSEVKSQMYQNTEVERSDVFNASARCDRQFNRLMPSMELSQVDRQWLKADGGQRLLTRMKSMGIELTRWWEVLDYWHKEHQLWAWRNQEGFSAKTDLEKRRRIKEAFAGWSKKSDNTNTLDEDLECFKSRLRRADDVDRTKQQVQREEDPTRRPRTEEELAEIIAIFKANKPTW